MVVRRKRELPRVDSRTPMSVRWVLIRVLVVVGVAAVILAMIVFAAVVGESLAAMRPSEAF